jgi:hypothetical protein
MGACYVDEQRSTWKTTKKNAGPRVHYVSTLNQTWCVGVSCIIMKIEGVAYPFVHRVWCSDHWRPLEAV